MVNVFIYGTNITHYQAVISICIKERAIPCDMLKSYNRFLLKLLNEIWKEKRLSVPIREIETLKVLY